MTPHIVVRGAARAADWYQQAFGAVETARVPVPGGKLDAFWGDRHGVLIDPFGHRWGLAQHLRDVPQEEIEQAAIKAFSGMSAQ